MTTIFKWLKNRYVRRPALLAVLAVYLISLGHVYNLSKSDWATWVGAIGTVFALGVAIYVGERQHRSALMLIHHGESVVLDRRLRSVLAVLDEAVVQVGHVSDRLLGEGKYRVLLAGVAQSDTARRFTYLGAACTTDLSKPQFVDLIEVINQIPVHELGHKDLVQAVFMTRRILINYDATLASLAIEVDKLQVDENSCLARAFNASTAASTVAGWRDSFEQRVKKMTHASAATEAHNAV